MTDKPTDEALENLFVEETGFDIDDFPAAIFDFARAVLAKWGTPAPVGAEPVALLVRKNSWRDGQWEAAPPNSPSYGLAWANQRMYVYTAPQPTPQPTQPDPAYSAACNLATALFKKHFAHLPDFASGQAVWSLCDSTAGVISQIDNMVSGLVQPPTTAAFSEDELQ